MGPITLVGVVALGFAQFCFLGWVLVSYFKQSIEELKSDSGPSGFAIGAWFFVAIDMPLAVIRRVKTSIRSAGLTSAVVKVVGG